MRALTTVFASLLLVLGACGDDDDTDAESTTTSSTSSESTESTTTSSTTSLADQPEPEPAGDAVELDTDAPSRVDAGPVAWEIEVTNVSDDEIVLTFPTSQPGDAVLLDGEREVHRWSDGRFFTQAIQEKTLAAGESFIAQLEDDLSEVEPGSYTLVLSLNVVGPPDPIEQSIRVDSAD